MKVIQKASGLRGTVTVPGDKSVSHRSVMIGAIAEGDTVVRGFLKSADCLATIDCFRRMGIEIEETGGEDPLLIIHGRGLRGLQGSDEITSLYAANSGTTVRLMSGILAGQGFVSRITGDASLSRRPMRRILEPLGRMGINAVSEDGSGRLPIRIEGGRPGGICYEQPVASAQVKSCVLLAGLYADSPCTVIEPALSRNHTELMLEAFGGRLDTELLADGRAKVTVFPGAALEGREIKVPGDISSAAYFLAAGLIVPDSEVTLRGVGINETRDGILRVIRAMGGEIEISGRRMEGQEPAADLTVRSSRLHGTEIGGAMIPTLIDEIPVIAVMAACAEGDTVIRDAGELKVKETDRLAEIVKDLRLMGISAEEAPDGMVIHGGRLRSAVIDPAGDHRMAMASAVAGLAAEGGVSISDEECVNISYPGFFRDLQGLIRD